MIFLTNKYTRFCSAMRNHLHKSVVKKGVSSKYTESMRKVFVFEAVNCKEEAVPTDISEFLSKTLCAAYINKLKRGEEFSFKIKGEGCFLLETKPCMCLLLSLCRNSRFVKISVIHGKIVIKAERVSKESILIARSVNGQIFVERKTLSSLIVLSPTATDKFPIACKSCLGELDNPLSMVNVFIN